MTKTLNYHTPQWLIDLPPGEYTLKQLVQISGAHKAAASKLLREYGAERKYDPVPNSHLTRLILIWPGITRDTVITKGIN